MTNSYSHSAFEQGSEEVFRDVPPERDKGSFIRDLFSLVKKAVSKLWLIFVVVIFAFLCMLYTPIKTYYHAWRDYTIAQSELEEISQDNEDTLESISRLRTYEGIEEEARKHGYVTEGETAIVVTNSDDESVQDENTGNEAEPEVPEQTDTRSWFIIAGDTLFGYDTGL